MQPVAQQAIEKQVCTEYDADVRMYVFVSASLLDYNQMK